MKFICNNCNTETPDLQDMAGLNPDTLIRVTSFRCRNCHSETKVIPFDKIKTVTLESPEFLRTFTLTEIDSGEYE